VSLAVNALVEVKEYWGFVFSVFRSSRYSRRMSSLLVLPLIVGLLALLAAAGVRTAMLTGDGLGLLASLDWNILSDAQVRGANNPLTLHNNTVITSVLGNAILGVKLERGTYFGYFSR